MCIPMKPSRNHFTIKIMNISITLKSYFVPIRNCTLQLSNPPSPGNHWSASCYCKLDCIFWNLIQMESYRMHSFLSGFFHSPSLFWDSNMLYVLVVFSPIFIVEQCSIIWTYSNFFILLMDICVVFSHWLLQTKLLLMLTNRSLNGHML